MVIGGGVAWRQGEAGPVQAYIGRRGGREQRGLEAGVAGVWRGRDMSRGGGRGMSHVWRHGAGHLRGRRRKRRA